MQHPRVSLHQIAFMDEGNAAFVEFCRAQGIAHMTMAASKVL